MKRGAVAVINVVEQIGNMHVRDFGNCGGPCFNLGTADGAFPEAAIERAAAANVADRLRIQLRLEAGPLEGLTGTNAVGLVRGRRDESIIVNAHGDGWFDAAGDNADGLAVLVALARHNHAECSKHHAECSEHPGECSEHPAECSSAPCRVLRAP